MQKSKPFFIPSISFLFPVLGVGSEAQRTEKAKAFTYAVVLLPFPGLVLNMNLIICLWASVMLVADERPTAQALLVSSGAGHILWLTAAGGLPIEASVLYASPSCVKSASPLRRVLPLKIDIFSI